MLNQTSIHSVLVPAWPVSSVSSLFGVTYNNGGFFEQRVATGPALLCSSTTQHERHIEPRFTFPNDDVTVEFLVKASQHGRTLVSCATSVAIAVTDVCTCQSSAGPCRRPIRSHAARAGWRHVL